MILPQHPAIPTIAGLAHGGQTSLEYGAEYAEPIRQWATGMGIPVTVRGEQKLENASLRTLKDFPRHGENSKHNINFNS